MHVPDSSSDLSWGRDGIVMAPTGEIPHHHVLCGWHYKDTNTHYRVMCPQGFALQWWNPSSIRIHVDDRYTKACQAIDKGLLFQFELRTLVISSDSFEILGIETAKEHRLAFVIVDVDRGLPQGLTLFQLMHVCHTLKTNGIPIKGIEVHDRLASGTILRMHMRPNSSFWFSHIHRHDERTCFMQPVNQTAIWGNHLTIEPGLNQIPSLKTVDCAFMNRGKDTVQVRTNLAMDYHAVTREWKNPFQIVIDTKGTALQGAEADFLHGLIVDRWMSARSNIREFIHDSVITIPQASSFVDVLRQATLLLAMMQGIGPTRLKIQYGHAFLILDADRPFPLLYERVHIIGWDNGPVFTDVSDGCFIQLPWMTINLPDTFEGTKVFKWFWKEGDVTHSCSGTARDFIVWRMCVAFHEMQGMHDVTDIMVEPGEDVFLHWLDRSPFEIESVINKA